MDVILIDAGELQAALDALPPAPTREHLRAVALLLHKHSPEQWERILDSATPEARLALDALVEVDSP